MADTETFEIVQWVDASLDEVFAFFTVPEKMVEWHGVEARLDPRPGGLWWVRHENGAVLVGEFLSLEPPRRLVWSWGFERPGEVGAGETPAGGSRVEVQLDREDGRTRIRLRHTGFLPGEPVGLGWRHFLAGLARVA